MSLQTNCENLVNLRQRHLTEANMALEKIKLLPPELLEMDGMADMYSDGLHITINKTDDTVETLKRLGFYDLAYQSSTMSDKWTLTGEWDLPDGTEVCVSVNGMDTPEHCRIEETVETREVKVFKAICNEKNEVITKTTKV